MSTEPDLKNLWNKATVNDMPDTTELLKRADSLRKLFRLKLIIQSIALIATIVVMLGAGLSIDHRQLTTTIGLGLMIVGVVSYLITINGLLPMLFKSDIDDSSQEYLNQLIRIQRNNEFLEKVMKNVYFGLLIVGLWLYLLQAAIKLAAVWAVLLYLIPSICMAIAFSYSKRKGFAKMSTLNETIRRLEIVNAQLLDTEG